MFDSGSSATHSFEDCPLGSRLAELGELFRPPWRIYMMFV